MQVYKVKRNQNIFDVAVSTHGSIEGIFDLLINNPDLSFHSQLKEDEEIYWDEEFIIYDSIVNTLQSEHIVPANGERHVYHKSTTDVLCTYPPKKHPLHYKWPETEILLLIGEIIAIWKL